MRKSKKAIFSLLFCLTLILSISLPSNAATKTYSKTITVSTGFTSAWEYSRYVDIDVEGLTFGAYIVYGYDTWWVKEDYVKNCGNTPKGCYCQGTVTNSEGTSKTTNKVDDGLRTGKADVKHTGTAKYKVSIWF